MPAFRSLMSVLVRLCGSTSQSVGGVTWQPRGPLSAHAMPPAVEQQRQSWSVWLSEIDVDLANGTRQAEHRTIL
jgi:hypothetical protein